MNNPETTMEAVRNAYRLVYAYQGSLIQIIRQIKTRLDVTHCWDWELANGRLPTRRSCPLGIDRPTANLLPFLYAAFYYTDKDHRAPVKPGDCSIAIIHAADSSLIDEDDSIPNTLDEGAELFQTDPAKERTLLSASIVVNKKGSSATWPELFASMPDEKNPWIGGDISEDYEYYGWQKKPNEEYYSFNRSSVSDHPDHELEARLYLADMHELAEPKKIEAFLARLVSLKDELCPTDNGQSSSEVTG